MPKLSILGTGWGTRVQAPAFKAAGWTLHALWGRSPEKVAAAKGEHGFLHTPSAWERALAGADLVSITTPPFEHLEQTAGCLRAGVNVLCEKPTALNSGEAGAMLEAERASRAWGLIDHELRFLPARRRMRDLVAEGYLGDLLSAEARVAGDARADPRRPFTWWSQRDKGGGLLGAVGSHVLDGLRFVLGRELTVLGARLVTMHAQRPDASGAMHPVDADDYAALLLDAGGAPVSVVLNAVARQALADLLILRGTEGTLVLRGNLRLEGARGAERVLADLTPPVPDGVPAAYRADPWKFGTYLLARELREAVEANRPPADGATFEDGLAVQRLLDETRRLAGWA